MDFAQLDHEVLTAGSPAAEGEQIAGLIQENLTPEEQNRLKEIYPVLIEFNELMFKAQNGLYPDEVEKMASINEQGMPSEQGFGTRVPQDMQNEAMVPSRPVEGQVPQNAPEMMSRGGEVGLEAAKNIVREKYPQQARYLDNLNIVMKPDMEGHSEYRSGDYDDSKEYGYKHTIEINPRYSKTPEEIASTIAGETLHHMKDKDPEFRQMWLGLRETLGQDPNFRKRQETRQDTMNRMRQEEFIREGRYKNPISNRGPYNDTRDVDRFIDASALDEWIRAYQFKDDPIAGKHYDKSWKTDEFHKDERYQPQFENIRQYLGKGMATGGGVAAGPIGVVDKPGADNSGVADDVPAESDGFVINAAAVRHAGLRDINDMIQDAKEYAEKQGMKLNFGKTPTDAEQILVSNGEVVIPDVIANIIGYDRLEKINNRGKKETEEKIQQQEQQPQQPAPTRQPAQPVMQAAEGGEVFPAESALIQHERDKSRELATEVYEVLTKPETGGEKDPFIRTRVAEGEGSSAYGPVQITKGLMEDPRYSDIVDPSEFEARQRLIEQSDKFLKYGNKDWQKLLNEGKISQEEAEEAQALYEYGMPGNFVRTEKDKEDYKNYAITVIDKMLKELNIKDMNDKKKLIKFIRRWRGVDTDSQYEKDFLETLFPSSKKNLDK